MDCNRSNELMSLAIDQMLTKEETMAFEAHLESCDTCREDYYLYQSINADLSEIGTEAELPDGFHRTLMKRLGKEFVSDEVEESPSKVIPLWRRINRRTMNVAAMFALVVVFALVGVRSLNNVGVSDESAVMNEMPAAKQTADMEMAKEDADYGANTEKAAPKLMEAAMESDDSVNESEDTSVDKAESNRDTEDGGALEAEGTEEMSTMMIAEDAEPVAELDSPEAEAQLSITEEAIEEAPQLARTEETEVSSYKAKDHVTLTFGESKMYSGQGSSEGYGHLVWLLFGGFIGITGLGGFVIMRRMK